MSAGWELGVGMTASIVGCLGYCSIQSISISGSGSRGDIGDDGEWSGCVHGRTQ